MMEGLGAKLGPDTDLATAAGSPWGSSRPSVGSSRSGEPGNPESGDNFGNFCTGGEMMLEGRDSAPWYALTGGLARLAAPPPRPPLPRPRPGLLVKVGGAGGVSGNRSSSGMELILSLLLLLLVCTLGGGGFLKNSIN